MEGLQTMGREWGDCQKGFEGRRSLISVQGRHIPR